MANNITEKKKILYFDDEPFISKTLVKSLEFYDWDITFADNIYELFKELNVHKFDILILDIMAPVPETKNEYVDFTNAEIKEMEGGMNTGVVLAKKIWTEIDSNYTILFLTARSLDTISLLSRSYRFDYIRKPVLVNDLNFKLEEMLNS